MNKQLFEDCFKVQDSEAADFISKLNSEKCTIEISGKITEEQSSKLRESLIDKKNCKIALDLSNCSFEDCNPYFRDCTGLTSIKLPDSVTTIGKSAFRVCTGLTSITIPDSVTKIGRCAFSGCKSLTSINIPESVTTIGDEAFSGCTGLTSITIPESVTTIGDEAFSDCKNILITVSPANKHYCSLNGIVYSKSKNTIIACSGSLKGTIAIPDSVTKIGSYAFSGCTGLTSITIPDSVTTIGTSAFSGCTGLTRITIPDSVTEIVGALFEGCTSLINVSLPDSITNIYEEAFKNCPNLKTITIPKNCEVEDGAFDEEINIIRR